MFIDDVTSVIALALAHRSTGVLNVVSGHSVSFGELAAQIARLSSRPVIIEGQPRTGAVTHRHFDATARLRAFPTHPPVALAAGLARLIPP